MTQQNDLSEIFSSILYHISDYESILTGITKVFTSTIEDIDSRFFLSLDFLDYYKEYPKYPLDYKVIHNLSKYNLVSIYNVVRNNVKYLLDAIESSEVFVLKNKMDKIPNRDILQDYNLQTVYFSKISTDLYPREIYGGFLLDKDRCSYLFKTFGHYVPLANRESSLIYEYALYSLLFRNMRTCLKIYENAFSRDNSIILKNESYSNSFQNYINENKENLSASLVKYILEYTYKISNPSKQFYSGIVNVFVNTVLRGTEYLYNYISAMFVNSASDPEIFPSNHNLISQSTILSLKNFELGKIDEYEPKNYKLVVDRYSAQALRQYLYLVYYYKSSPRKFLNVLQIALINYVTQFMVDRGQTIFEPERLNSKFKDVFEELNMTNLCTTLNEIITPNFLKNTIVNQKISEYATRLEMIENIEKIFSFDNLEFENYVDELYDVIFDHLKKNVQIEPYYEYHFNKKMMYWYLIGCIKRDILQKKVFFYQEERVAETFRETLESRMYDVGSTKYAIKFDEESMRSKAAEHVKSNIVNIGKLFDNIIETAVEKKLHSENISYYFS